jgi:hypothetical protein
MILLAPEPKSPGPPTECEIRSRVSTACLIEVTVEPAKRFRRFQLFSNSHFARQTQLAAKALQMLGYAGLILDEKTDRASGSDPQRPKADDFVTTASSTTFVVIDAPRRLR